MLGPVTISGGLVQEGVDTSGAQPGSESAASAPPGTPRSEAGKPARERSQLVSHKNIIRAWKDQEYRDSLSAEQRALLPDNPTGTIDLSEAEMAAINGGLFGTLAWCTQWRGCSWFERC
jgi:mersacidin/lichenicidin family type 2 lantibiotic